jgi:hypothetical protein
LPTLAVLTKGVAYVTGKRSEECRLLLRTGGVRTVFIGVPSAPSPSSASTPAPTPAPAGRRAGAKASKAQAPVSKAGTPASKAGAAPSKVAAREGLAPGRRAEETNAAQVCPSPKAHSWLGLVLLCMCARQKRSSGVP